MDSAVTERAGTGSDIRPPAITAMRSARMKISSRSCEMMTTAAPACASAMIASWIASVAPASTPQVG